MPLLFSDMVRLVVAIAIGAIIGGEREYRSKSAGFRTMILVCAGSCIFTLMSEYLGKPDNTDRIAANIITGIGFLGAGVIFKDENRVSGITTATTIWMIAAIGMTVGAGYIWLGCLAAIIMFIVLAGLVFIEDIIGKFNQLRNYRIMCPYRQETLTKYDELFKECRLRALRTKQSKVGNTITGYWLVQGREVNHQKFIALLLKDDQVEEFDF